MKDPNRPMKGDWVRIDNPEMFVRCGYPFSKEDMRKEIEREHLIDIEDFIDRIGWGKPEKEMSLSRKFNPNQGLDRSTRKIIDILAYERLKAKGFGGRERQIHTEYAPDMKGKIFKILDTKCCMTGKYFAPSGGYDPWSGGYDYEPGGLLNQKCHRILRLDEEAYGQPCVHFFSKFNEYGYRIEDIHVTKIHNPKEYIEDERKRVNKEIAKV
jgi:hypothetical protein